MLTGHYPTLELPPLPASQVRLMQLLPRHDVDLAELVEVVETDPGLTVAALRAANSAISSPVRRIGTARAAVVRMGGLAARRMLGGYVLSSAFVVPRRTALDLDEYWKHALATALLADAIAVKEGGRTEAFTAGLLHDVGCLAMACAHPERYARVIRLARRGMNELAAERAKFGFDHCHYGEQLGQQWELPSMVVEAIVDHEHGTVNEFAQATARARGISRRVGIGNGRAVAPGQPALQPADHGIIRSLRGPEGLMQQIAQFRDGMGERAAQFGASGFVQIAV